MLTLVGARANKRKKNTNNSNVKNTAEINYLPLTELVFLRESILNPSEDSMEFLLPGSMVDLGKSFRPSLMAFPTSALDTLNSFMASLLRT